MRLIFLLALFTNLLFGASLLTYNIYERSDRVDIMLSFDVPYEGQIYQRENNNEINLVLENLSFDESIKKDIASPIVQDLLINRVGTGVTITLKSSQAISLNASKTVDGFGLRVRIRPSSAPAVSLDENIAITQLPQLKNESTIDSRYISVMVVMFLLIVVLFFIKRKFTVKSNEVKTGSWLFNKSVNQSSEPLKILHQKQIDQTNKMVLLEYNSKQYLIVSGGSNLLLDKFNSKGQTDEADFNNLFEQNRQKLDEYLQIQQDSNLGSYKQRVSKY